MLKQYTVDAFTDTVFHGNPAAVCILDTALPDDTMLRIAQENNLSETAFAVRTDARYRLRWFTPGGEIDLCGHATLATAFVLMNFYARDLTQVVFDTLSGALTVTRRDELYEMDFPAYELHEIPITDEMTAAIGIRPAEAWMGRDLICVLASEEEVKRYTPALHLAEKLSGLLLHTTARGTDADYVLRSYAPKLGVPEDPVCGSGNCYTAVLWAKKLGRERLTASQESARGGTLCCHVQGSRVLLSGKAALYAVSDLYVG